MVERLRDHYGIRDEKVLEAMRVTSPVTDGVLEFTYPDDAAVADYLRKRFRLK